MGELDGRTALVTGGARGFGRAVARRLAREGCDVAVADLGWRRPAGAEEMSGAAELDATVAELRALGRRSVAIAADVTAPDDCESMAAEAIRALGGIDILVANAGVATLGPAWELTPEEWDRVIAVNLTGVWLTTKYVVPRRSSAGGGGSS